MAGELRDGFDRVTARISRALARPAAFLAAVGAVVLWAAAGPVFGFSDGWQMVVNTGTGIVTFLMTFLLLASSSREGAALQLKLDELLRASQDARNELIAAEARTGADLEREAEALASGAGINSA